MRGFVADDPRFDNLPKGEEWLLLPSVREGQMKIVYPPLAAT